MNSCILVLIEGKVMQKTLLSLTDPLRFKLFPSFSNRLLLGSGAAANIVQWYKLKKRRRKNSLAPAEDDSSNFLAVPKYLSICSPREDSVDFFDRSKSGN